MMKKQTPSSIAFLSLLLILAIFTEVEAAKKSYGVYNTNSNNSVKLFVFGDSYVDTGNFLSGGSYKPPSGITFPGKPAGRFGNGCVLTDYVELQYGMNFACGGIGIFQTLVDGPNMTVQIDSLEKLIQQNVYTKSDLESSFVLVNAGANDYTTFLLKNSSEITRFTESLVKEVSVNLRRIHNLGAKKIAVRLLQPIGCLPIISVVSLFQNCIDNFNLISQNHNTKMLQTVQELNQELGKSVFKTLDLYNSFLSTITTMQKRHAENSTLMNPLEPCCAKEIAGFDCGKLDDKGGKNYSLCEKPELSFFWDNVHPSQDGWYIVSMKLQYSFG